MDKLPIGDIEKTIGYTFKNKYCILPRVYAVKKVVRISVNHMFNPLKYFLYFFFIESVSSLASDRLNGPSLFLLNLESYV